MQAAPPAPDETEQTMADTQANMTAVRRIFEEGINKGDTAVVAELIDDRYVNHDMPAPAPGPEGFNQVIAMFKGAFPDLDITLDDVIGDGDKVCTRGHFTGTHSGEFMGVPATGKQVETGYIDVWRFEGGRAVENWVKIDMLGVMIQLGVVPPPPA